MATEKEFKTAGDLKALIKGGYKDNGKGKPELRVK